MKNFKFISFFLSHFLIAGILSCSLFNDFQCFEFHSELNQEENLLHPPAIASVFKTGLELTSGSESSAPHEHRCAIRGGFNSLAERKTASSFFQNLVSLVSTAGLFPPQVNFYENASALKNHLNNNFALYFLKLCKSSVVILL